MIIFIILVLIGLPVMAGILDMFSESKSKKNALNALDKLIEEKELDSYNWEQFEDGHIIINDRSNLRIWVVDPYGGWVGTSYGDIEDVELTIDDSVEFKSSLSSAAGRAILGGVLAGGVGAIIGGVTGKKNSKKIVHKIELILSYNAQDATPYSRITLLNSPKGEDVTSDRFNEVYENGLHWSKLISSLN